MKDFKVWRNERNEAVGDPVANTNVSASAGTEADITPEEENAYNKEVKGGRVGTLLNLLKSEINNKLGWFQSKPRMMGRLIEDMVDSLQLKNNPAVLNSIFSKIRNKTTTQNQVPQAPVKPQPMPQITPPPQQQATAPATQQQNDMF